MGRLTAKEAAILVVFACAIALMALAAFDFLSGGDSALDLVELSITTFVLSRVM